MRVAISMLTALVLLQADTGAAANNCCNDDKSCPTGPCCKHHADIALEPMETGLSVVSPGFEWPIEPERPVREYAKVLFRDPVKIGDRILIGAYVIEHDVER